VLHAAGLIPTWPSVANDEGGGGGLMREAGRLTLGWPVRCASAGCENSVTKLNVCLSFTREYALSKVSCIRVPKEVKHVICLGTSPGYLYYVVVTLD
jgi:hypothetical protein